MKVRDCKDFLKMLKKYMVLIGKSTGKTNKILCGFYNPGFFKADPGV